MQIILFFLDICYYKQIFAKYVLIKFPLKSFQGQKEKYSYKCKLK